VTFTPDPMGVPPDVDELLGDCDELLGALSAEVVEWEDPHAASATGAAIVAATATIPRAILIGDRIAVAPFVTN
jgi:hypothetical protein